MKILDCLAKYIALALAATWLFAYWQKRDDGRYVYHRQAATAEDAGEVTLIDTRTGTLYAWVKDQWVEMHPQSGVVMPRKVHR